MQFVLDDKLVTIKVNVSSIIDAEIWTRIISALFFYKYCWYI